jgi:hypothetical protein
VEELPSPCGLCGTDRSMTSRLTASTVATIQSSSGSPGSGATITGGEVRYLLRSWNASSASSVQMNGPDFRRSLKNGRAHSTNLEINRLSATKHPVSFCTFLMRAGGSYLHCFDCLDLLRVGLNSPV